MRGNVDLEAGLCPLLVTDTPTGFPSFHNLAHLSAVCGSCRPDWRPIATARGVRMGPSPTQQGALLGCYSTTYLADPRPISRSEALSFLFRVSISSDAARSPVCLPFIFTHRDYLVCPPGRLLHSCCCLVHRTDQLRFSICLGDKIHSLGDYPSVAHTKLKPVLPISVAEDFVTHDKCKENVHKHAPIVFHRFECFSLVK